eukprot:2591152-Pyramimonas_sp.AAC.1
MFSLPVGEAEPVICVRPLASAASGPRPRFSQTDSRASVLQSTRPPRQRPSAMADFFADVGDFQDDDGGRADVRGRRQPSSESRRGKSPSAGRRRGRPTTRQEARSTGKSTELSPSPKSGSKATAPRTSKGSP